MNLKRRRVLQDGSFDGSAVLYWMSRDQRAHDNWALAYAQEKALEYEVPLIVVFCLQSEFLEAGQRQFGFMLRGLAELSETLAKYHIPFLLREGAPEEVLPSVMPAHNVGLLVSDFSPLRVKKQWNERVVEKVDVPVHEVDAHNIVPVWEASDKKEFAAHTIRKKIHARLPEFLEDLPELKTHPYPAKAESSKVAPDQLVTDVNPQNNVPEVEWITPGEQAAHTQMWNFIEGSLTDYDEDRNDPNNHALSDLSPYYHFGQLAAHRVALEIDSRPGTRTEDKNAYLEELIVRKELSDNFCFYEPQYDAFEGFPDWAKQTLNEHRDDKREHLYTPQEFEEARTHDDLWNAAQMEMVKYGKMHGFMRMYWAKKILEWTESPEEALEIGIWLNDTYELDGRDPNGYVGVAWSVGGVHDRAWPERDVYGKVRYMNYNGCKRKFDVNGYITSILGEKNPHLL